MAMYACIEHIRMTVIWWPNSPENKPLRFDSPLPITKAFKRKLAHFTFMPCCFASLPPKSFQPCIVETKEFFGVELICSWLIWTYVQSWLLATGHKSLQLGLSCFAVWRWTWFFCPAWSPWRLLKDGAKQQNMLRWIVHSHTHQCMFQSVYVGQTIGVENENG